MPIFRTTNTLPKAPLLINFKTSKSLKLSLRNCLAYPGRVFGLCWNGRHGASLIELDFLGVAGVQNCESGTAITLNDFGQVGTHNEKIYEVCFETKTNQVYA